MQQTIQTLEKWTWYPFTKSNLDKVPQTSDVNDVAVDSQTINSRSLGINSDIIYIGSSANLHERLTDHYYTTDPCIQQANQFAIETCSNYMSRERELLQWFRSKYGRLPRCNDRI